MRGFHGLRIYLFSWERKILLPTSSISLKSRKISLFFPSVKGKHVAPNNRIVGCMENQSNFLSIAESCHRTCTPLVTEVNEQKKKRMKADSDLSRLSPAASMRSQLEQAASLKGEQVAARVTPDNAEKDEWFVVKVIHFDREAKEFEVLDEEPGDDEESVQRKYKLPMSRIIPFPKRGDPSSAPDFPHGRPVLAVYPGTTALYKATVVNNRKRKTDEYLLEFDDDEEDGSLPQRNVPFYRVVPLPEGHRQ